jgi:transcriptional regulator
MYKPKHFSEARPEFLHRVIREYPFASLVVVKDGIPDVNHLPLVLSEDGEFLRGHLARGNDLAKPEMNQSHLWMVFHGPHAYVTPTWYPSKKIDGKTVPTWNYIVVHVEGDMTLIEDKAWLLNNVEELSKHHEKLRKSEWQVNDAPVDYLDMMTRGIVGIEIKITSMTGKFKLSQNRSEDDQKGVIEGLKNAPKQITPEQDVAHWMGLINSL